MVIRHTEKTGDVRYEIRTAGRSIRLYTAGAFHSQYHPGYVFTGGVWDLLSLPSLALPDSPLNILVLGVAGGTAIHQLYRLHDELNVTGIELDPVHIRLAREYFHLDYPDLELVQADAAEWLSASRQKFDYIIDDIFLHGEDDPQRPFALDRRWFRVLRDHLNSGGGIVQNHIGAVEAVRAAGSFGSGAVIGFETDCYENRVLAFFDRHRADDLNRRLEARLSALPRRETSRLRHHHLVIRD